VSRHDCIFRIEAHDPGRVSLRMMSDWKVELLDDSNTADFYVTFYGPKESPYEGTTL